MAIPASHRKSRLWAGRRRWGLAVKHIAIWAALALSLAMPATATAPVAAETTAKTPAEQLWDGLTQAFANANLRPPKEMFEQVKALVDSPDFKQLDVKKRQSALVAASSLAFRAQEPQEALRLATAATEVENAPQFVWLMRLGVGQQLKSSDTAVALTGIAERWPEGLRSVREDLVSDVVVAAHRRADPRELALLQAPRWTRPWPISGNTKATPWMRW